eukprot:48436-Chlamydomonas_euryale.AAC.1
MHDHVACTAIKSVPPRPPHSPDPSHAAPVLARHASLTRMHDYVPCAAAELVPPRPRLPDVADRVDQPQAFARAADLRRGTHAQVGELCWATDLGGMHA